MYTKRWKLGTLEIAKIQSDLIQKYELTQMFDIDKLYLSRLYFRKEAGKATSSFEEGTHEYYANRLLNNYIALLKDTGSQDKEGINRTANQNHASIDGDTKLLKDIVKDLEEGSEGQELDPFTPYSLWANAQTKTEFITGKFGIGPFALNNNSHILTMLYGVRFIKDSFLGRLGMNRLDKASDRYGNSILSWLSGLINAHVDVAKDPYISKLNVNPYTYNLINLMIRTGFGKDTFYFTKQPIMLEMARAYNNAASQYGQESSRSKYRRQKEAVDEVVFNFVKRNFHIPSDVTNLKQANKVLEGYFRKVRGIEVEDAIRKLLEKDNDIMHQISKKKIPMDGKARMYEIDNGIKLSAAEVQYIVYRAKIEFQPFESDLSDLVKYSKIDTKKQGKNIVEQMAYKDGIDTLFDIEHNFYGKFETLKDYYTDSYIKDKTENALNLFFDIMSTFSIESTPQFQIQISEICRAIGEVNPSADVRKAVSRQIMNYIRAGFFNTWAENNRINIKGLVSGKNTISDRLEDIRIKIMTDPAYVDMRANDGSIKNYLLASLVQGFQYKEDNRIGPLNAGTKPATHNTAKFVKTLNFMDSDHINEDDMAEAWDELLNNEEHQDIKDFARDLIMYAFITSGGNSGQNMFKFIPNSWKLNSYGEDQSKESFAQYMQKQLDLYKNATEELLPIDIDEIILNNWFDDKFIPTVKPDGFTGYYTGRYFYQGNQKPDMSIPVLLIKENASEDQDDDKYIKVRRDASDQYTPRNYTIYKAVAYTTDGRLIYAMVDPKGNKFPRDVIYEMRRDDSDYKESATVAAHSAAFIESIMITKQAMGVAGSNLADILRDFVGELKKVERGTAFALLDLFTKDATLKDLIANAADLFSGITVEESRDIANTKQEAEQNGIATYKPIQASEEIFLELQHGIKSSSSVEQRCNILKQLYNKLGGPYIELANLVFDTMAKFGIDVKLATPSELGAPVGFEDAYTVLADYNTETATVRISTNMEDLLKRADSIDLTTTLLHEAIHSLTTYAIMVQDGLSNKAKDAVSVLEACYERLINEYDVQLRYYKNDYYGLRNPQEMVAEIANPNWRNILKKHKLLDKIIKAVKDILSSMFNKNSVNISDSLEKNVEDAVKILIQEFNPVVFNRSNLSIAGMKYAKKNLNNIFVSPSSRFGKWLMQYAERDDNEATFNILDKDHQDDFDQLYDRIQQVLLKNNILVVNLDGGFGFVKIKKLTKSEVTVDFSDGSAKIGAELAALYNVSVRQISEDGYTVDSNDESSSKDMQDLKDSQRKIINRLAQLRKTLRC